MKERVLIINGEPVTVRVLAHERGAVRFEIDGRSYQVELRREVPGAASATAVAPRRAAASSASGAIQAPMPGVVSAVFVSAGDTVEEGQVLLRIEAMKMQNPLLAPRAGSVQTVHVSPGAEVRDGDPLITLAS